MARNMPVLTAKKNKEKGSKASAAQMRAYVANLQAIPYSEQLQYPGEMILFRWGRYMRDHGNAAQSQPRQMGKIRANSLINFVGSKADAKALAAAVEAGGTFRDLTCERAPVKHLDIAHDLVNPDNFEPFEAGAFVFAYIDESSDAVETLDLANLLRPHTGSVVLVHDFVDADSSWFPLTLDDTGLWLSGLCADELDRIKAAIVAAGGLPDADAKKG